MTKRAARGAVVLAGIAALALPLSPVAHAKSASRHEVYPVPPGKVYTFHGRGYGHGHGMSQWGAYGAVKARHRTAPQVLHFYYPHTTLRKFSTRHKVHVLLSALAAPVRGYLEVEPAAGLTVKPTGADPLVLPRKTANGRRITAWRLQRNGSAIDLRDYAHGHWHTMQSVGAKATFTDTAQELEVRQSAATAAYRGALAAEVRPSTFEAINILPMETYLRGVVAAEMPASWPQQALQAQAIASRSYAWYEVKHPKASWFDVYGDTRDQAYGGVASENPRTSKAIDATAGEVLVDSSKHPIFAQFASADGGWTVAGGQSYLPAKHDPYDGAVPNAEHEWTTSVAASTLQSAYPRIGRLVNIAITRRDGNGKWGGRVLGLTLHGDAGSVDLTGSDLQFALGLRSPWFRPVPTPAAPRSLTAKVAHRVLTVQWKAPKSGKGAAAVSGYQVRVLPDKRVKNVSATVQQVSFGKLASGSHTVTLTALSSAGHSRPVTVVVETGHK